MLLIGKCSVCNKHFNDYAACFSTIQFSTYYYCAECGTIPPAPLVCPACHEAGHMRCGEHGASLRLHRPAAAGAQSDGSVILY